MNSEWCEYCDDYKRYCEHPQEGIPPDSLWKCTECDHVCKHKDKDKDDDGWDACPKCSNDSFTLYKMTKKERARAWRNKIRRLAREKNYDSFYHDFELCMPDIEEGVINILSPFGEFSIELKEETK